MSPHARKRTGCERETAGQPHRVRGARGVRRAAARDDPPGRVGLPDRGRATGPRGPGARRQGGGERLPDPRAAPAALVTRSAIHPAEAVPAGTAFSRSCLTLPIGCVYLMRVTFI